MSRVVRSLAFVLLFACAANAATTNNDDSCDIAVLPAATLLLPYFEVDVTAPQASARTTLFTVVNTTNVPRIARVTLWTDLGYPIMNFNIFLTGYDVQSINLFDVLVRGLVAGDCTLNGGLIPAPVLQSIDDALTHGTLASCGSAAIGLVHPRAIGYATIDVVKSCGVTLPDTPAYYDELLYDNVLTGDYETINPSQTAGNYAGGNPLVHIRAIPEGGAAGTAVATNLPFTFYDRYTPRTARAMDRRQPLPATFSARFIAGGPTAFDSEFRIWREGLIGIDAACADYAKNLGSSMKVADVIRYDEHENPTVNPPACPRLTCQPLYFILPETSSSVSWHSMLPPLSTSGDLGGWIYFNLNNASSAAFSSPRHSQNWVVVSMSAEGRFSVMFDATMLANGCTPAPPAPPAQ